MRRSSIVLGCLGLLGACAHRPEPPGPPPKVRIGLCTGVAGLAEAKAAGFDYVELGVSTIARLTPIELEAALIQHRAVGLPTPVANGFLPKEVRVTGPRGGSRPAARIRARGVRSGAALRGEDHRVRQPGGAQRPRGAFRAPEALRQLVAFGKLVAPEAASRGLVVTVEALRRQESNILNTPPRRSAGAGGGAPELPAHGRLLSPGHREGGSRPSCCGPAAHIRHFHFANPDGRVFPLDASEYDYYPFFASLYRMGFQGGMSIEARAKNGIARDGPIAVGFLRARISRP